MLSTNHCCVVQYQIKSFVCVCEWISDGACLFLKYFARSKRFEVSHGNERGAPLHSLFSSIGSAGWFKSWSTLEVSGICDMMSALLWTANPYMRSLPYPSCSVICSKCPYS